MTLTQRALSAYTAYKPDPTRIKTNELYYMDMVRMAVSALVTHEVYSIHGSRLPGFKQKGGRFAAYDTTVYGLVVDHTGRDGLLKISVSESPMGPVMVEVAELRDKEFSEAVCLALCTSLEVSDFLDFCKAFVANFVKVLIAYLNHLPIQSSVLKS